MLKISTKSIDTNKTSPSENGLNRNEEKNKGGFLGGLKYLGQSVLAGVGSVLEGIVDVTVALGADLTGNHDFAESMFENNVVGDWHADNTEEFNPGGGWQFFGDVGQGLGQSAFLLVPYAGLPIFITGVSSQGISDAAEQTGDVGIKETAYGITMGAVEGGLEATFSGMGKAGTKIAANMASRSGKSAVKGVTKSAVRKSAGKKILSDAASEFLEESVSEVIDVGLQRAYQIDPDKQLSIRDVLYSGAVGAVSGGISSGVSEGISLSSNLHRGNKIVKNGNEQTLVNTATSLADRLAASGTKFEKGPEWVKRLRGEVDAYDKLSDSEKQGTKGKVLLGEMQSSLYFAETQAIVSVTSNSIMNADLQTRATIAEYINQTYDKSQRKRDFTAEDIKNNTENIATGLAILKFASYVMDPDAAIADLQQEQGIANVIARESGAVERTGVQTPEAVPAGAVQYSIERTKDMNWEDQLKSPRRNDTFVVEKNTPSYLTERGISDRPLAIPQSVITKAKSGKDESHSISDSNISKLQSGIKNAIAAIDDKSRNSFVVVTNLTENGKPIIVSFSKDTSFDGDIVHQATSIHARQNIQAYISKFNQSDIKILNKNEFDILSRKSTHDDARVQESDKLTDSSISHPEGKVKSKTEENVSKGKTDVKGENLRSEAVESWSSRGEGETQKNTRRDLKRGAESGTIDATASRKENSDGNENKGGLLSGNTVSEERGHSKVSGKGKRTSRDVNSGRVHANSGRIRVLSEDSEGRRVSPDTLTKISETRVVDEDGKPISLYHATDKVFDKFYIGDVGFHFGNKAQADTRASVKNIPHPLYVNAYLNIKNPLKVNSDYMNWHANSVALNLWNEGVLSDAEKDTVVSLWSQGRNYDSPAAIKLREILESKGYDGIAYPNGFEGEGTSYIAFRDEQIIRADGNSEGIDGATGASNGEVDLERAKRDAERMIEWEKKNAPTAPELNTAREYVKRFDNLPSERQLAIVRMMRSAEGVDADTARGVANIMAITNSRGQVLAPDLEFRFAEFGAKSEKRGIKTEIGGKTVIVLNVNAKYKDTIRGSIAHEIVHYLENRTGYKTLAEFAMKHAKADKVAEVRETYTNYYRRKFIAELMNNEKTDEALYDLDESFGQQLQDWREGNGQANGKYNGKFFKLGTTPDILIKHGAPSGEVIMYEDCLLKITGLKHSISLDELSKIPSQLNDPILLFKGSVENSFVALTEIKDKIGNDVIVAVHINKKMGRSVINKITSVYSKTDDYGNNKISNYVTDQIKKGNLLDASVKKAPNWFTTSGLQLPHVVQTILDANNSIHQKNDLVNTSEQKNNLTDFDNIPDEVRAEVERRLASAEFKAKVNGEITASVVGEMLNSEKLLKRYVQKDDSTIKKIGRLIKGIVTSLKGKDSKAEAVAAQMAFLFDKALGSEVAEEKTGEKYSVIQKDGVYYTPTDEEIIKNHPTINGVIINDAEYAEGHTLPDDEYKAYRIEQAKKAKKNFGVYTNKDAAYSDKYGQINAEFGNITIRKGKFHGGIALYDILPYIPQIFESAVVIDTKPDSKSDPHVKGIVDLVGCAILNDKYLAVVKLNVKEYANDEAKIYDNKVLEIEELTVVDRESQQSADSTSSAVSSKLTVVERVGHQEAKTSSDSTSSAVSSKYIIAKFREFVKNNDEKKSLTNSDIKNSTEQYDLDPEAVAKSAKEQKLIKENEKLKQAVKKERSLREKMAREEANAAKAEAAKRYTKKQVEPSIRNIEALDDEEVKSLGRGYELEKMSIERRERLISDIYIALHEASAKGEAGPGSVAVKILATRMAWDVIDSWRIKGQDGKRYHVNDVYDEASVQMLVEERAELLYKQFANMGKHTKNSFFLAEKRAMDEKFKRERLMDEKVHKLSREVAYQGKRLRKLVERQKRDMEDAGIIKVTKTLASVVDTKGNIRIGAVDDAIAEADSFYSMESAKLDSETKEQLLEGVNLTDFALEENNALKFMLDEFKRLRSRVDERTGKERRGGFLDADEMRMLGGLLMGLRVTLERYNKAYINGHWIDIDKAANDVVTDVSEFASIEKKAKTKVGELFNSLMRGIKQSYFYNVLSPETVIESLEGFKTGGVLKTLYHDIRVHKQRSEHMAVRMKKPFAEFLDANREIEVEVSGEDFNDRVEKSRQKGKKITPDMSDDERYEVLNDKKISLTAKADRESLIAVQERLGVTDDEIEYSRYGDRVRLFKKLGEEFSLFHNYSNGDVKIDFSFSRENMRESVSKQGKNFMQMAKMLTCLNGVIDKAVGIEVHNRNGEAYKSDNTLENVYVLASAFVDGDVIVPVKLEIKRFSDKENTLYVAIALESIKTDGIVKQEVTQEGVARQYSPPSNISIAQFFEKINIKDESFLKYIPDGFLNSEQIEAKRRALDKDAEKYGTKKANENVNGFPASVASNTEAGYRTADTDSMVPHSDSNVNSKVKKTTIDPTWKDEKGYKVSGANSVTDSDFDERSRIQKNVSIFNSAEENADVLNMISSVEAKTHNDNDKVYFENVSDNIAKIIHQLTGVDVKGFKVAIEARQLEHILNRHGKNGKQDQSLSDNSDIAKIESVLKNPDKIRRAGKTKAYSYTQDNKNKTADTVLYEMLLKDKSYYVVKAVPDTKSKTLYIVTAFMGEQGYESKITKGTPQLIDANAPTRTSENDFVVVPKNIIHQSKQNVNKKISTIKVDPTWKEGKGHKHSYRDKLVKKTISVCGHEITLGEAIYLYMLTKRRHAHAGLKKGGFITYDENNQQKLKFRIEDIEAARAEIFGQLDAVDKVFLNMAEDFFNITASEIKRNADMEIFGYTNNEDGYYVPIIRDRYSRMMGVTDARQSISSIITAYNPSFTQKTVHNAKALEGKSIMDIICDHADALADYSELYLPLKSFDRIYNRGVAIDGEVTSLREVLQNKVWNGTDRYLRDLFADIQGQNRKSDNVIDSMVGKLRSAWVNSVLGLNLKVVVTQTTSFVAANQVIEAKYLMPAMKKFFGNQSELGARADEYSDIIEARSFEMGALRAQGNIDKVMQWSSKTGFMINLMDRRVCLAVFHAAELKAEAQGKGKVGTVENARAAARIADEAIFTTQAMTSAAERSALQRSKSEIARALSMFTSDSVKNLSHFVGNIMKYQAHKARAKSDLASKAQYEAELNKDAKAIRRSAKTLVATGVMLGLITQAFKYLYAKEEEEPEDKVKDLATDIVASTFNILPGVSDAIDKFVFDYDMSLNVFDVANDTIEDTASLMNMAARAMRGEYVSGENVFKNVFNFVKTVGAAFGAPVAPVERTVTGLLRRFAPSAVYGYDAMMYNPSYTADLKKAVEDGDERLAEHILETLYKNEATGVYSSTELEEVADLYQKGYTGVLPQRIGAEINGMTLNRKQRKQFESIYSEASDKVNAFIRSEYYDDLTDAQKAKAIKNIYALYYNRAAAEVVGEEWSNAQAYSRLTDNYSALFAAQAYKSGLSAYKDASGKEVTVKEQFVQYVKNLGLSREDELVVLYANGYRDKETKAAIIEYINSLSISAEEKEQIAKRLGFAVENGKVVEKKEELEIRA